MGCASSAALPFLTGRGTQAVTGSAGQNGKLNNALNGDAINGVKDINETYVSDKMKDVVDSSAVQGVIGGVVDTKDNIINQVKEVGDSVANKLSSVVGGVESTIESSFHQVTEKIGDVEEMVKSEVKHVGEKISSVIGLSGEETKAKEDDIDELLAAIPDDSADLAEKSKAAAEELIEAATEEVTEDEMKD